MCSECGAPWIRVRAENKPSIIAAALQHCREQLGISAQELATLVGVGSNNIWDWEHGGHVPTGVRWEKLSSALKLGVSRDDFIASPDVVYLSRPQRPADIPDGNVKTNNHRAVESASRQRLATHLRPRLYILQGASGVPGRSSGV